MLRLDGKVKGRQYDRLGYLHVGGVEVLRTSTPEPSADGIAWNVEKDVTRYSDTFRSAQPVEMLIGNAVDDTYTGVIDVKVTLTFYAADGRTAPAAAPDKVLPLDTAQVTTPRNSERLARRGVRHRLRRRLRGVLVPRGPRPRRLLLQGARPGPTARCRSRSTANSRA